MLLSGKVAIVTGASQGMGREIALLLAKEGASLVVNSRGVGEARAAALNDLVESIRERGGAAIACPGSVADPDVAVRCVDSALQSFGRLDILVNNAGVLGRLPVDQCPVDHWREVLDINLGGTFYMAHFSVPHMKARRWGRIVNCASGGAFGHMGGASYAASKGGVISLTYAMARDLGMYGITSNAYNPQARSRLSDGDAPDYFEKMLRARVERGFFAPEQFEYVRTMKGADGIAPWVVYLCLDEADYINGQLFGVEGRRVGLVAEPAETKMLFRDYDAHGPWTLDELRAVAPMALQLHNKWPKLSEDEIRRFSGPSPHDQLALNPAS